MATNIYNGFSTMGVKERNSIYDNGGLIPVSIVPSTTCKLNDEQLVTRDLLNAFNIRQGEKPGNPKYGTIIQGFMFEPNIENIRSEMEMEIRRVVSLDPRIILNSLNIYSKDNQVTFQMEVMYAPFNNPTTLTMGIDRLSGRVSQVA
jgi:phage baseplate assembly protein W